MPGNESKRTDDVRKARLAQELRANLQKRKQQARSRRMGEADQRPDGIRQAARDHRNGKQG